jgi:hypothetical protein
MGFLFIISSFKSFVALSSSQSSSLYSKPVRAFNEQKENMLQFRRKRSKSFEAFLNPIQVNNGGESSEFGKRSSRKIVRTRSISIENMNKFETEKILIDNEENRKTAERQIKFELEMRKIHMKFQLSKNFDNNKRKTNKSEYADIEQNATSKERTSSSWTFLDSALSGTQQASFDFDRLVCSLSIIDMFVIIFRYENTCENLVDLLIPSVLQNAKLFQVKLSCLNYTYQVDFTRNFG